MSTVSEPIKRKKHDGQRLRTSKRKDVAKPASAQSIRNQVQSIDLLAILLRRKLLIAASAAMGLLIGIAYMLLLHPTYESEAEIMLLQNDSVTMASQASGKESISQDLLATHMSLVQSRRIIQQALTHAGLREMPSLVRQVTEKVSIEDYVKENLYVTRGGKGSARNAHTLNVAFRHTDKADCTKIVEAIVSEYQDFVATKFKDINEEAVKLIKTARVELDQEIEQINEEYREFRDNAPLISNQNSNIHEVRYQEIATEIATLSMDIDENKGRLNLVLEGMKRLGTESHPLEKLSLIDDRSASRMGVMVSVGAGHAQTATFQSLQPIRAAGAATEFSKLLELRTKLTNARVVYGPKHPQVQELETQVDEIERFLEKRKTELGLNNEQDIAFSTDDVMNSYIQMLKNDIFVMEQRLSDLKKQQIEAETEAKNLVRYELANEDLLRRRERQESLYDSVITRLREINMRQDSTGIIQEVIQPATIGEKVSPNGLIAVLITTLATGLLLGFGVLVAELLDKSVHSVEELEELYGSTVIGQVLDFGQDESIKNLLKQIRATKSPISPELIAFHDSKNPISEVIRTIRTQVLFNLGVDGQVLAVTSPQQGDGKSTVTSNLAVSLAITNKRVLLVDCDLRRPQIHKMFGVDNDKGLSDICLNRAEFDDCTQTTLIENLTLIASGGIPEKPAELLSSSYFIDFLAHAKKRYDIIVLDCPPLLPVADPAIIAQNTDGILLVTRTDAESLVKSQESHRILSRLNTKLVGIIVNRTSFNKPGYYKKYRGYYQ